MDRIRISSGQVFVFRYLLPSFIIIGIVTLLLFGEWNPKPTLTVYASIVLILLAIAGVVILFAYTFQTVEIDETHIYLVGIMGVEAIPVSRVHDVTEWKLSNPRIITIHLLDKNMFWQKIRFPVPQPLMNMPYLPESPIVEKLLRLAEENRAV